MKKFGFATVVASGFVAAILGLAVPAQAVTAAQPVSAADAPAVLTAIDIPTGVDHHAWLDQIGPHVNVPQVDTSVQQSR